MLDPGILLRVNGTSKKVARYREGRSIIGWPQRFRGTRHPHPVFLAEFPKRCAKSTRVPRPWTPSSLAMIRRCFLLPKDQFAQPLE